MAWRRYGAPRRVVQWLRNGVPLRWRGAAPRPESEGRREQDEETRREMEALVKDGAFIKGEATVVSPTFLIPKRDGTNRLIHDLRRVNKHIAPPHFTLHGAQEAGAVTRNSRWLAVLDLRHGYQQVAMEPSARRFLGAMCGDETVVSTVLPFGLNLSPYIFTRLTNWLAREIRKRFHLEAAVYIDDFLLGSQSREELERGIGEVKGFFAELGVQVSEKKEIKPAQEVDFIGFRWNSARKTISVPRERRKEYRKAVKNLLRHGQTRETWRRVVGKLGFLREAVGPTMRHVRSLLHAVARRKGRGKLLEAQGEAREDLEWWLEKLNGEVELALDTIPVTGSIASDASDGKLGYLINIEGEQTRRAEGGHFERSQDSRIPEAHINRKEIEAILRALENHRETLRGRHLVWYTDSSTALAAIKRQGTQKLSKGTWEITKRVLDLAEKEGIRLLAKQVPGRLNGAADALSRLGEERRGWEQIIEEVTREWGPLQEDPCGATKEPTSLLESLEWADKRTLLLPKAQDVGEVMKYLALCAADTPQRGRPDTWERMAVLITPLWRGASWWPMLEKLRVAFLDLGRWSSEDTRRWQERNGRLPGWTASLIPLAGPCGRRGRGASTLESY